MRKAKEMTYDSGIYARLRQMRMSDADRERAAAALRQAEHLVDAIVWAKEKVAGFGNLFLKPGLKH